MELPRHRHPLQETPPSPRAPRRLATPRRATSSSATLYERLADAGLDYGPAFQGLSAAWKDGEEVYAEVALAEEQAQEAERFGIHPALLDAALHAVGPWRGGEQESPRLPFSWQGVSLHGQGPSALRVKLTPKGDGGSIPAGRRPRRHPAAQPSAPSPPASSPRAAAKRKTSPAGPLGDRAGKSSPCQRAAEEEELPPEVTIHRPAKPDPGADPAQAARAQAEQALAAVQEWLAADKPQEARFALLTEGAVATTQAESPDLALASALGPYALCPIRAPRLLRPDRHRRKRCL